jgi:hypothetical protein
MYCVNHSSPQVSLQTQRISQSNPARAKATEYAEFCHLGGYIMVTGNRKYTLRNKSLPKNINIKRSILNSTNGLKGTHIKDQKIETRPIGWFFLSILDRRYDAKNRRPIFDCRNNTDEVGSREKLSSDQSH